MRSGAKVAIVGGVFVVVAGGVAYGAYSAGERRRRRRVRWNHTQGAPARTGPLGADEIKKASDGLPPGVGEGRRGRCRRPDQQPGAAAAALSGYRDEAHITDVVITPGAPTGAVVPFTVKATVSFEGKTAPLSYTSQLTVVRGKSTRKPLVDWQPAVLHPQLKTGERLVTGEAQNPEIKAVDYKDRPLTKEKYPSLGAILDGLREKYGAKVDGTAGIELQIQGNGTPARTLITLQKGTPGKLKTTLDADVQAAAEKAVKRFGESSVVAVKPSTGEIRAVADNRTDKFPASLQAAIAPGSTMKIITATMLMNNGLGAPNEQAECPSTVHVAGRTPSTTWTSSRSRTPPSPGLRPFLQHRLHQAGEAVDDEGTTDALGQTAREYFGIGQNMEDRRVPSFDGSVPAVVRRGDGAAVHRAGQGPDEPARHGVRRRHR